MEKVNNNKIKDLEHQIKLLQLENKALKDQLEFYMQQALIYKKTN